VLVKCNRARIADHRDGHGNATIRNLECHHVTAAAATHFAVSRQPRGRQGPR